LNGDGVLRLPERIAALPHDARARANGLFRVEVADGRTDPPPEMHEWLEHHFGSVAAVRHQSMVNVTNRWSLGGSIFSPLRGKRPIPSGRREAYQRLIEASRGDPFCDPEHQTPADTWGRVRGRHAVTGANAAMSDAHHGVMVFDRHDPLAFDAPQVVEMLHLGRAWADRSRDEDPAAVNYLLIWNCGPRAGGSVIHGHAQLLLGRGSPYPRLERLRRDADAYRTAAGSDYVADLVAVHRDLGLVVRERGGVAVMAHLTPIKERELLVVGQPGMDERDDAFADAVASTVIAFRDILDVDAFNLALHRAPIDADGATDSPWRDLPPMVHIVDRGDPASPSSDIGAMELYAASVIGVDPFDLVSPLRAALESA
jgi:hypothetical protein